MRPEGVFSEYSHHACISAISDFVNKLPNKEADYYNAVRKFALSLYQTQGSGDEKYFLEKTPRYYLILDVLQKIFPDAKFIFLFRNPVQVMASVIETWGKGRLRMENYYVDLFKGPEKMAAGYNALKNNSVAVFYDDLVRNPENNLKRIFEYLELDYSSSILTRISQVKLDGRMGDKSGYSQYNEIEPDSIEKWKETFNTRFRKKILKTYIRGLSPRTLKTFGISQNQVIRDIDAVPTERWLYFQDRIHLLMGTLIRLLEVPLFYRRTRWRLKKTDPFLIHQ